MDAMLPIDQAFDAVMRRRDDCRERVATMTAAALAGVQAVERHMSLKDQNALAIRALQQDPHRRLGDELRRVKDLTLLTRRLTVAKRLGVETVRLDARDLDLFESR